VRSTWKLASLAAVALAAVAAIAVLAVTACTREEEAEPAEPTTLASPTPGGFGVMPWAVVSPAPANMAGSIAGTPPAAPATAEPTASPTAAAPPTAGPPTLTPQERTEAEALLRAAALRPEDIPEGLPLEDEGFITNEELAETGELSVEMFGSAGGAAPDPYSSGRILGYDANYDAEAPDDLSSFSGTASFGVSVELFQDSTGAHEYFEQAEELARQQSDPEGEARRQLQEYYQSLGLELSDLSVSSLSVADLGEERVALEVKGTMRLPGFDADLDIVEQAVGMRRGRLVGSVTVLTVNESPDEEQLEDLARKLDERMKDALE